MILLNLTLGSRDHFHSESTLLLMIVCCTRRIRRYSPMFSWDFMVLLLQFPSIDKHLWITMHTCHSYIHSPLILLLQDTSKFSLLFRQYFVPTALQFLATWIPLRLIPRTYRVSAHSQLFMCFAKDFEIPFDLPKILSILLLLKFLLACIMVNPLSLVILLASFVKYHFESIDSICCECSQSSIIS